MKYFILSTLLLTAPIFADQCAAPCAPCEKACPATCAAPCEKGDVASSSGSCAAKNSHGENNAKIITGDQLKSWIDQKKAMTIVDARSKAYFDGTIIPNAKWISVESSDADIQAALPAKDVAVIVYCANRDCPASNRLANRLAAMGYTNVYEYSEGIADWTKRGYSTAKAPK